MKQKRENTLNTIAHYISFTMVTTSRNDYHSGGSTFVSGHGIPQRELI